MRLRSLALAPVLALTLALGLGSTGCASSTMIEHVWRAPNSTRSYSQVVIFGMSKNPGIRRAFEETMVAAFANVGIEAVASFELFPSQDELRDEDIARVLGERGTDAALVARLVGVSTQTRYVDGMPYAMPYGMPYAMYGGMYGGMPLGFFGYYHGAYGMLYSPGYMVDYDIVTIETNFYDVASSELVWSGLSETFAPESVEETIESYAQAMVTAMVHSDLVTRTLTPGAIESHD